MKRLFLLIVLILGVAIPAAAQHRIPVATAMNADGKMLYTDYSVKELSTPAAPQIQITQEVVVDYLCVTSPGNPPQGLIRLYCESTTGQLTCLTYTGANCLAGGGGGGGGGSVASVGLLGPTGIPITNSPVTSTGTLTWSMPAGWILGDLLIGNGSNSVARLAAPTSPNDTPQMLVSTPVTGVGQMGAWALAGLSGRVVSGTTDTILATDRAPKTIEYTSNSPTAITVPEPASSGFTANPTFVTVAEGAGPYTFTPAATAVITYCTGALCFSGQPNLVLQQGQYATWSSPSTSNWLVRISGTGPGTTAVCTGNQLLSGGGVVWTGLLNFTVSSANYCIAGTTYTSAQTNLTLGAADPTNPRIDVLAVDNTGTVVVIPGTPAASPAAPSVDPTSQLALTFVTIPAGATTPTITSTTIYDESSTPPTEWTCSSTAAFNCSSTNNPYHLTHDIEVTNAIPNGNVLLTNNTTVNLATYNTLSFYIRNKAAWATSASVSICFLNGTAVVGNCIGFKNGVFGFDQSNITGYQQIVIPIANFGTGSNVVNKLRFQVAGASGVQIGFYLDWVQIQTTLSGSPGSNAPPPSVNVLGTDVNAAFIAANRTNVDAISYAAGGGTANAQTVSLTPVIVGLTTGLKVCWKPSNANASTTPTLAVNGLTAKTIIKVGGAALAASDLTTTAIACAIYDGTNFELQNPQTTTPGGVTSLTGDGTIFNNSGSTGAVTLTKANQNPNVVLAGPSAAGGTNVVQSVSAACTSCSASQSLTINSVGATHTLLVAAYSFGGTTVTSTGSETFTKVAGTSAFGNGDFYYTCSATGGNETLTLTGQSNNNTVMQIYEISGNDTSSCKDVNGSANASPATQVSVPTSGSVNQAGELVFVLFTNGGGIPGIGQTITFGPGYTKQQENTADNGSQTFALSSGIGNSNSGLSGVQTATASMPSAGFNFAGAIVTIKLNTPSSTAQPTFRALVTADLPSPLNGTPIGSSFNVTPVTVNANSTADQNLQSLVLPAGFFNTLGKSQRIWSAGVYSTPVASTATLTFKLKLCTVSGCGSGTVITLASWTTSANPGSVTTNPWNTDLTVITQTAGSSGALESHGNLVIDLGATAGLADSIFSDTNTATVGTIDLSNLLFLQQTVSFSAASASNTCVHRQMSAPNLY